MRERREKLNALIEKFQIKVNTEQELHFKKMIEIRCQKPSFFYDFKKNRTVMLKAKEPEKKEHYHIIYLR